MLKLKINCCINLKSQTNSFSWKLIVIVVWCNICDGFTNNPNFVDQRFDKSDVNIDNSFEFITKRC